MDYYVFHVVRILFHMDFDIFQRGSILNVDSVTMWIDVTR